MSFLCQRCQNTKATVHITDTVPQHKERHLCEDCAEKEGVIVKQHHSASELLQQFIKHKTGIGGGQDLACPKCGMNFREFQLKGLLGCPNDYEVFRAVLKPLIERAHEGGTHHVGKVPVTADDTLQRQAGLSRLRRELQNALSQEDYETAARVRDQIQALESP